MTTAVFLAGRRCFSAACRPVPRSFFACSSSARWYSSTQATLEEDAIITNPTLEEEANIAAMNLEAKKRERAERKKIVAELGRRRNDYNRQVSLLRKEYMEEYQRNKKEDEALRNTEQEEAKRRRLERQRAKNERSVQNAMRQIELRRQTQLAFEDHLVVEQEKRDAKKALHTRAQQLLIDELEEEALLWMTTPEEVEAAFTPEAEQLLWARPNGVLGVPNPSLDSHFWQFETHTWDMSKTYKTHRDILLEEYQDEVYKATNIDPKFWTPERLQAQEELERKAKLRANVRLEGRRGLLRRQQAYFDDELDPSEAAPPKPKPIPSLGVLANVRAQEKEGAAILFKDPTQFFIFDRDSSNSSVSGNTEESESYSGPALGAPVDIRDPLRTDSPQGRVFPLVIGKLPKPDKRTEKEKKRQEREEKLLAAAQAQTRSAMSEIDLAADEDEDHGEPLDYDNNEDWDSDDEEWNKGLDPELDSELINMPRELRYSEEDIQWVIDNLEARAKSLENHMKNSVNSMEQELRSRWDRRGSDDPIEMESGPILDENTRQTLSGAGADPDKFENLMQSLSHEQLLAIFALEGDRSAGSDEVGANKFEKVPDLTEEQLSGLTEMEAILLKIEHEN